MNKTSKTTSSARAPKRVTGKSTTNHYGTPLKWGCPPGEVMLWNGGSGDASVCVDEPGLNLRDHYHPQPRCNGTAGQSMQLVAYEAEADKLVKLDIRTWWCPIHGFEGDLEDLPAG